MLDLKGADPNTKEFPHSHDIPTLWERASLPALDREGQQRLLTFTSLLVWSSRYPTPSSEANWQKELEAIRALDPPASDGKIIFRKPLSMDWTEFDALYQVAHARVMMLMTDAVS